MRKKSEQAEQSSPSNLPAVRFDRMAKEKEKSNQEPRILWSGLIKCLENMLSWPEMLLPLIPGIKEGNLPGAVCAGTGWQRIPA